ncbi:MAG: SAM-dependent methyltransferase [Deltaproteobacteria bacterium]|nr:SAM-dependent methyltransferase [Deltaproteobacteria bacterium]
MSANEVSADLLNGQSRALLHALHLLTPDGKLNADARRKLKQINHFAGLLRPALHTALDLAEPLTLVDAGTGNGYLGLLLYELFIGPAGAGEVIGLESNGQLVDRATSRARHMGFDRMRFVATRVAEFDPIARNLAVVALHACDTATDDAIALGLRREAKVVAVVPCCQAELAHSLSAVRADHALAPLWRFPILRRGFAAHLTNVLRALVLECHGYQVTVTELVGWEHSFKNELILARKVQRGNSQARNQLKALLQLFPGVRMGLLDAWGPDA